MIFKQMIREEDIAMCIEQCIVDEKYWIDKQKIADQLHITLENIEDVIEKSNIIILNNQGELTTRKLYKQNTPFLGKLLDTIKNKIE